jgi:hypothetical protein
MASQDKEIAQFQLENGTTFLIEIERTYNNAVERIARPDLQGNIVQAKESFEKTLDKVMPVASAALNRIRDGLTTPASEVEIKFGLKMTAEAGAIIASVGSEVNFEVTLKWKHNE